MFFSLGRQCAVRSNRPHRAQVRTSSSKSSVTFLGIVKFVSRKVSLSVCQLSLFAGSFLSVCLSVCLFFSVCTTVYVCLLVCLSDCLSFCLRTSVFVDLKKGRYYKQSIYLFVYLFVCLFVLLTSPFIDVKYKPAHQEPTLGCHYFLFQYDVILTFLDHITNEAQCFFLFFICPRRKPVFWVEMSD